MRVEPIRENLWFRLLEDNFRGPRDVSRSLSRSSTPKSKDGSRACSSKPRAAPRRGDSCPPARPGRIVSRHLEPLPAETWDEVFFTVMPGDLCALRATCRSWRGRLDDPEADSLWESAYRAEWRFSGQPQDEISWRLRFLGRWWAHARWGVKVPTVCTLMGKKAHEGTVTCVALGASALDSGVSTAFSASDDGSLFLWRFPRGGSISSHADDTPHGASQHAMVAQQHHRQCQGMPQRAKTFYGHAGPVWCLWFDPDRDLLLSGGYDATVKVWSLAGERCVATLRGHDGWVRTLDVMQAGRLAVSGGSDGVLKFWSLDTLHCLHSRGPPNGDPRHSTDCLAAIEEQDALLSGHSGMRHLLRWDMETLQCSSGFVGHEGDIYAMHADGPSSLLVTASKDRTVRVWDTRSPHGRCQGVLSAHTGAVLDVKIRGNRVVSASMDKTVRMWDIRQTQAPMATLEGHSAEVHCVDFRDRMVLSGSRDTSLKAWTVI